MHWGRKSGSQSDRMAVGMGVSTSVYTMAAVIQLLKKTEIKWEREGSPCGLCRTHCRGSRPAFLDPTAEEISLKVPTSPLPDRVYPMNPRDGLPYCRGSGERETAPDFWWMKIWWRCRFTAGVFFNIGRAHV